MANPRRGERQRRNSAQVTEELRATTRAYYESQGERVVGWMPGRAGAYVQGRDGATRQALMVTGPNSDK